MMRNPFIGRVMTVHLAHRKGGTAVAAADAGELGAAADGAGAATPRRARQVRSRYAGPVGQPRLSGRLLPFAPAADAVVALTQRQAHDLQEDVPGLEVHVIPNMIDPVPHNLVEERDPCRVVQLGRLDSVKRVDHAIRAVGIAAGSLPGLHLEVYGRGPELEHLLALRSELGLDDVVSFPGFTDDPIEVLAGAAASMMTSRREGFGLAVAESLAAGTPVVTYDVDYGPAELVADGVNGRVVPDGSVVELAGALVEVLRDGDAWSRMSQAAPAAAERLRPDVVATQWLDIVVDVAERVKVPPTALLVEDLRVRRGGLEVAGVLIGKSALPASVGIAGGVEVALEAVAGQGAGPSRSEPATGAPAQDVHALLPWSEVARWPQDAALVAHAMGATRIPVVGPGLPVTVAPTDVGPVVVGWDEPTRLLRRVTGPDQILVAGRVTSMRVTVGEDVTVLSELPVGRARVLGSRTTSTDVEVQLLPGLALTPDSELAVAAGAGDRCVRVGRFHLTGGQAGSAGGSGAVTGVIEWDAEGLGALKGLGLGPVLVWLAVGRSQRLAAPLEIDAGQVLGLGVGDRWVLAPSASGRAMLVPGRGLRVRAAQVARRLEARIRGV
jgi:hypothetical protein